MVIYFKKRFDVPGLGGGYTPNKNIISYHGGNNVRNVIIRKSVDQFVYLLNCYTVKED